MLSKAEISKKPKKTLVLMATLRKLGKKDKLEKKDKESLVKLIYSKQKGKKVSGTKKGQVRKTARKAYKKVSGTKKGQVRKTARKAYEGKAQYYKRIFIIDYDRTKNKIHIFDTYWEEDLFIKKLSNILPTIYELRNKIFKDDYKINIKAFSLNWYLTRKKNKGRYYFLTNDLKKLP